LTPRSKILRVYVYCEIAQSSELSYYFYVFAGYVTEGGRGSALPLQPEHGPK